ncbi:hypothetical protein OE749_01875 [Aestuariibacter sp. AA17]|uniref:Uncharacterized protein n=1 Tax=Fluctibacter corallii TaxID=2984329 RepID=A0ABT3A494_9ALTE|nr:hypothetical protein [Aestuariibacter sp. AA17]MCV2883445.1 hypothetical protein [Aestuariibacter sp. AA17]
MDILKSKYNNGFKEEKSLFLSINLVLFIAVFWLVKQWDSVDTESLSTYK